VLAPAIAAIPESLRDLVPLVVGLGRETRHQRRRAAGAEARRAEVDARAARLDEPLTRLLALVARLIDDGAVDGGIAALEIARDLLDAAGDGPRAADAATALREIRAALAPSSV